jgi:hypothetical protein
MTNKQHAQWGYESRVRKRRDSAPARLKQKLIEPVLPDEMTDAGKRMEAEIQERRDNALKLQMQRARLKRHKLFAVKLRGGEVRE